MATLNNCRFIGRMGAKAEIKQMNNGKDVASFSLAIDQSYKKDGEKISKTEWVKISVFNEAIVNLIKNYVDKGSLLYIEGALQTRKWKDGNGIEKYSTEIVLKDYNSTLQILNSMEKGVDKHSIEKGNGYAPQDDYSSEEVPF